MSFSADNYRDSVKYYQDTWRVMDDTLYQLCRENPGHSRRSSVCAKLWIIGRTYATGIERKVQTDHTQGSSMSKVTEHFLANAAAIDGWFDELRGITEPLEVAKCKAIVSIHGRMVRLLCPITRKNQSTPLGAVRSLKSHHQNAVTELRPSPFRSLG